jgi:hypothetical protein
MVNVRDAEEFGAVELARAIQVLARSDRAMQDIGDAFDLDAKDARIQVLAGGGSSPLDPDTVHDFFLDQIANESKIVWNGLIHREHDDYGVWVQEYEGVFVVKAVDYWDAGYFLEREDALSYIYITWDDVDEVSE